MDCSIKVSVANLSITQTYHIEGRNYGGDPGNKPMGLDLGRCSNNISNEGQAGEDMENEPGQK